MNEICDVRVGPDGLRGDLGQVPNARGLVIFAHGSGSSRRSPRNRFVAGVMRDYGFDTLLFDLLTDAESAERRNVFCIRLLSRRLAAALAWQRAEASLGELKVALFGASTGAAAALETAARHPYEVAAIVCRGGRPDLAAPEILGRVKAPTLLVVGGRDDDVVRLNRHAARSLHCETRLEVVPGATHLFEEPGALETVAHLAGNWFALHLNGVGTT